MTLMSGSLGRMRRVCCTPGFADRAEPPGLAWCCVLTKRLLVFFKIVAGTEAHYPFATTWARFLLKKYVAKSMSLN